MNAVKILVLIWALSGTFVSKAQSLFDSTRLVKIKTVKGNISPKSVVYAGNGKFFAQNMMYKHSITVYDSTGELLKTIKDTIRLSNYGVKGKEGVFEGAPVEACLTPDEKYMWVSNYEMYGKGFDKPGCDACHSDTLYDKSYLYGINTETLEIDKIAEAGSIPKFMAVSPDGKYLAVSNWSSNDVSMIDPVSGVLLKTLKVGRHPRGVIFNENSTKAYIAIMGGDAISEIDINTWKISKHEKIGDAPRHLLLNDSCLYYSLSNEAKVRKWNLKTGEKTTVRVGNQPRSMSISSDGAYIYVVNYRSATLNKVRTLDMKIVQTVKTNPKPIGVTVDLDNDKVWVACYGGTLLIFDEKKKEKQLLSTTVLNSSGEIDSPYHIIAGSFPNKRDANFYAKRLEKKGYTAIVLPSSKGRYRISVFQTESRLDANKNLKNYRRIRKDVWILRT